MISFPRLGRTALFLALLGALLLPTLALAGGVVVSLDEDPPVVEVGKPFSIGFTIRSAHDGSRHRGPTPFVTATLAKTKQQITVEATPDGAVGHYIATLTLPEAGEWAWEIQPLGKQAENYPPSVMTPLLAVAPTQEGIARPAPGAAPSDKAVPWAVAAVVLALPASAALIRWRGRRTEPTL